MKAPLLRRVDPDEASTSAQPKSPVYEAQQRSWNERYSVHVENARHWRWTAFGAIGVSLLSVGGMIHYAELPRTVPFVVEVDKLGDAVAVSRAAVAAPIDPRILRAQLARWIWDVRTVSSDALAERHFIYEAMDMTDVHGAAAQQLQDWFTTPGPFKRAVDEMVEVSVTAVLQITAKTWRIEWREDTRTRGGTLESSRNWEATITVSVTPPTTEAEILKNPSGLFVESFSWTERR